MASDPCRTCGEPYPTRRRYINETGTWICDMCGAGKISFQDVFWDGKPEINLMDGPDGKPRTFLSKGQKAQYLKERGILEAGDRVHGAPFMSIVKEDKSAARKEKADAFRNARQKVESMGQDQRRQAVLKVIKQARDYRVIEK